MIRLKLKKDIYTQTNIKKVVDIYKQLADIVVEYPKDGYVDLCFTNCRYDEQLTIKEFENYLIGMENV